jgi:hypothetical protein
MPQQAPFGDIFLVNTPSLDRTSALLYQEQRQRQAKAQQANAAADAQMQKEFANVKSADIPDVIDSYNKYKGFKKQLYFDKSLQNDPKKYAQVQQQANEALADTYSTINGSKENKEYLKGLNAAHATHPDNFSDNYGDLISAAQSTPLKQLKSHKLGDLTNMNTFMYQGPDQDFSKIFTGAQGQLKPTGYSENTPIDKNGLQYNQSSYEFGNTPAQYAQSVIAGLGTHKASKAASYLWQHVDQNERDKTNKEYDAIPTDKWKKIGLSAPQDLPTNTGNDAVDFANFQAKKYMIANEPRAKVQVHTDEAKKFQMETQRQQQMKSIEHANAKDLVDYKKKIDPNDTQLNDTWANSYRDKLFDEAKSTPLVAVSEGTQSGNKIYGHRVPLNKVLVDALTIGKDIPDRVYITDDNKVLPIYLHYDDKGKPIQTSKGAAINEDLSRPISDVQFAVQLGAKNATGKAKAKEIKAALSGGAKPATKLKNDPLGLF